MERQIRSTPFKKAWREFAQIGGVLAVHLPMKDIDPGTPRAEVFSITCSMVTLGGESANRNNWRSSLTEDPFLAEALGAGLGRAKPAQRAPARRPCGIFSSWVIHNRGCGHRPPFPQSIV